MKNIFMSGTDFETFESQAEKDVKDKMQGMFDKGISEELKLKISNINKPIHIAAISELWCPDCVINDVALMHLHANNKSINIRVFDRSAFQLEEVMTAMASIDHKIPTFIVMNEMFEVMGIFSERPEFVVNVQSSDDQVQKITTMKKYRNGEYVEESIKDLLAMMLKE